MRFRRAPQRYRNCRTQTRLGQEALALSPWSELDTENPGPHNGHRDPCDLVPRPACHTQPARLPHRSPQAGVSQPSQRSAATRSGFLPRWSPLPASAPSFRPLPSPLPASPPHPFIPPHSLDSTFPSGSNLPPTLLPPPTVPVSWFRWGHRLSPKPRPPPHPHPSAPGH